MHDAKRWLILTEPPKGAGDFSPAWEDHFPVFLANFSRISAVIRFMIAVTRLANSVSSSILFLLSFVFPFGDLIIAYSAEYVKRKNERSSKKYE